LSARLAATGEVFTVQVLRQGRQALTPDEALALGVGERRSGYAREVLLRVDGQPLVFARSVTAHANAVGAWRSLRGLGNRPLADVLFRRAGISRTPMAFAQPARHSPLQRHVAKSWLSATGTTVSGAALPARHSVFTHHRAALLVMEAFAAHASIWHWPDHLPTRSAKPRKLP
jgi:chorismate--pyruvate lyase